MINRYLDILAGALGKSHIGALEVDNWFNESTDKITTWLVGLSTGTIALLMASKSIVVSKGTINVVLILLTISIISGCLGRIVFLFAARLYKEITSLLQLHLDIAKTPYFPRQLRQSDTATDIFFYIRA